MALQARNSNARTIRNMLTVATGPNFEQLNVAALKANANHLRMAWNLFLTNNAQAIRDTADRDEITAHEQLFDEIERDYLIALPAFEARYHHLEQEIAQELQERYEQQIREAQEQGEHEEIANNDANDNASNHSQPSANENANVNANADQAANDNPNLPQQPPVQLPAPIIPTPGVQLQPIYLSCQGSKQLENTWGEFDGKLTNWQGFHDRFKASVHDKTDIPDSYKFVHLQNSLKGRAAAATSGWSLSAANYQEAWARLNELYARKYHTSKELLDKFYRLPVLEKPNGFILQKFSNTSHKVLRQFKTMNYPVEHYDLIFVHKIHEKLDNETKKAWELQRTSEEPTISEMLRFLDWQARALTGAQPNEQKELPLNQKRQAPKMEQKGRGKLTKFEPSKVNHVPNSTESNQCVICKETHRVYRCGTFLRMNLNARNKAVRDHRLCNNCLRTTHYSKDCLARACLRCDVKHNSLLCPENPMNKSINVVQSFSRNKRDKNAKAKAKTE